METKMFPIQRAYSSKPAKPYPLLIPWSVAELAYSVYASRYGTGQSLARLAERGGFCPFEMDDFNPGWREQCSEIAQLRADNAELAREVEAWRDCAKRFYYEYGPMTAIKATDASGALERAREKR